MTMLSTLGRGQQRESGIFRIKAAFSIVISADVPAVLPLVSGMICS